MDQWKPSEDFFVDISANSSQRVEHDGEDPITARKVQKADREKLRRDRLNEQFLELGKALDPDRPKNDKATILADTIQMLKDSTTQVNKLKAEYASLSEESSELTREKNELREEKATLKSEIDNQNAQYRQRLGCVYPWAPVNPSVIMGPPSSYSYPMPVQIPPAPFPIHQVQPYPFFHNQTPNPCSAYIPYTSQGLHPYPRPNSNKSQTYSRHDSRSKSLDQQRSSTERSDDFSDVVTELALKTPGSAGASSHSTEEQEQDSSSEGSKGKQWPSQRKSSMDTAEASSSSRCSSFSSHLPKSSSHSVGDAQ